MLKIMFIAVIVLLFVKRGNNHSPERICTDREKRAALISFLTAHPEYRKELIDSIQLHHSKEMIVAICGMMQKNERFADEMNNAIYHLYTADSLDKPCGD